MKVKEKSAISPTALRVATEAGKRVASLDRTDGKIVGELRALFDMAVVLMNEADQRQITVNFSIDRATPGGPLVLKRCEITKIIPL